MIIKITITEENQQGFFRSLPARSYRQTVREILYSGSLNWSSYWDISVAARKNFVLALLWAEMYPLPKVLKKIILEEKRMGPVNTVLRGHLDKWWIKAEPLCTLIKQTFRLFTTEEYMKVFKKLKINHLIDFSARNQLPLLVGDSRLPKYIGAATALEKKLKE
jgi:hypothetical protein